MQINHILRAQYLKGCPEISDIPGRNVTVQSRVKFLNVDVHHSVAVSSGPGGSARTGLNQLLSTLFQVC